MFNDKVADLLDHMDVAFSSFDEAGGFGGPSPHFHHREAMIESRHAARRTQDRVKEAPDRKPAQTPSPQRNHAGSNYKGNETGKSCQANDRLVPEMILRATSEPL